MLDLLHDANACFPAANPQSFECVTCAALVCISVIQRHVVSADMTVWRREGPQVFEQDVLIQVGA